MLSTVGLQMPCCVEGETRLQLEDDLHDYVQQGQQDNNADFAAFVSSIPGSVIQYVVDFGDNWNLCFGPQEETKPEFNTHIVTEELEFSHVLKQRTRNKARNENKSGTPSPKHCKQHVLSAKQNFELHARARNACRTPVGFQRVLDDVNQSGGSAENRAAKAKFSVLYTAFFY